MLIQEGRPSFNPSSTHIVVRTVLVPILNVNGVRTREAKWLARGHTARSPADPWVLVAPDVAGFGQRGSSWALADTPPDGVPGSPESPWERKLHALFTDGKLRFPKKGPQLSPDSIGPLEEGENSSFISDGICSQEGRLRAEPGWLGRGQLNSSSLPRSREGPRGSWEILPPGGPPA